MTAAKLLSDMTGIPVYRIQSDDPGEYITKKGALEAMELYATDRLDSYKEALRSAIEDRIKQLKDDRDNILIDKDWLRHSSEEMAKILSKKYEAELILGIIDSVTPKE